MSTFLDPSNITWSSLEPDAIILHTTLPDRPAMNQMSLLENTISARIIESEEYDQILDMV